MLYAERERAKTVPILSPILFDPFTKDAGRTVAACLYFVLRS
jgi:hypothetical protein